MSMWRGQIGFPQLYTLSELNLFFIIIFICAFVIKAKENRRQSCKHGEGNDVMKISSHFK